MAYISIRNKSIPKRALLPSAQGAGAGTNIVNVASGETSQLVGRLGEACNAFTPVYFQNGDLLIASNTSHPAEYLTLGNGDVGDLVPIIRYGLLTDYPDSMTSDLYLGQGEVTLTPSMTAQYFQRLAIVTGEGLMVNIYDYYTIL